MPTYLIICALSALYCFGTVFAYFTREHPTLNSPEERNFNYQFAAFFGVSAFLCPILAVVAFICGGANKHGWAVK